uniref:Uncharacterized protein n=1 Tax=Wuchereria bancrofti TaxID=6293 RepID=A0A1I8EE22_WUCBA
MDEKLKILHAVVNKCRPSPKVWEVNTYGTVRVRQAFRMVESLFAVVRPHCFQHLLTALTYHQNVLFKPMLILSGNETIELATCLEKVIFRDAGLYELEPYGAIVVVLFPGSFQTGLHVTQELYLMIDFVWNRSSQEIRNEYGNDFNVKAKAFVNEMLSKLLSKDTAKVINAYYEAIVARRPKFSYRIGWDTSLIFYPYSFMPLRVQFHLMKFLMNLFGAPVRNRYGNGKQ